MKYWIVEISGMLFVNWDFNEVKGWDNFDI